MRPDDLTEPEREPPPEEIRAREARPRRFGGFGRPYAWVVILVGLAALAISAFLLAEA